MTPKQNLIMWINSYAAAKASGDANLISVSIESLQETLRSVPETWDQQTLQEGTQEKR